jgi:hypothetical protein
MEGEVMVEGGSAGLDLDRDEPDLLARRDGAPDRRQPVQPMSSAASRPVRSVSTWAAIVRSAFQPLQICRVRSSWSRPGTQLTSSGRIPVS